MIESIFMFLFEFFKDKSNAFSLASWMFLFAGLFLGDIILRWASRYFSLRKLLKEVSLVSTTRRKFYDNYYKIKEIFETPDKPLLKFKKISYLQKGHGLSHCWLEFSEAITEYSEKGQQLIQNTARPHHYIDSHYLKGPKKWSHVPNIFVGIGLLCTFLGLSAALQGISLNGNMQEMQEGLQHVLSAASVKFITSITGLFISIILTIAIKWTSSALDNKVDEINKCLERGMIYKTSDVLAYEQLVESKLQTEQLTNFNGNLAAELGKEIEERLSAVFKDGIGDVVSKNAGDEINAVSSTLTEVNSVLANLSEKINNSGNGFGNQIEEMSSKLNDALDNLGNSSQSNLEGLVKNIDSAMSNLTQKLDTQVEMITNNLESGISKSAQNLSSSISNAGENFAINLGDSSTKMSDAVDGLKSQMNVFSNSVGFFDGHMKKHLDNVQESTRGLASLISNMSTTIQDIQKAGTPFEESSKKLDNSSTKLEQASQSLEFLNKEMASYLDLIKDSNTITSNSWKEYKDRFENVDASLTSVFKDFNNGVTNNQTKIANFSKEIDEHFSKSIYALQGAISELSEAVEDINKKVN